MITSNMAASVDRATCGARPWNPDFSHSDRERWICIYPAYINSKKTIAEGRRIPLDKSVDNPTYTEIKDVCAAAGLTLGLENKVYPREKEPRDMKFRGRIRVQLKKDDGTPLHDQFPNRQSILLYLGEKIPKLKTRQQGGGGASQSQPTNSGGAGPSSTGGGKKKKSKRN